MSRRRSFTCKEQMRAALHFAALLLLCLCCFIAPASAQDLRLDLSYGYQNTAKAGRFLPLEITIGNPEKRAFSGSVRVYMAESDESLYEYEYPVTVEGNSERTMDVTVSLGGGVSQLLVVAVDNQGERKGSRRIGLNAASSDAELIVGLLSETPEALAYLGGVGVNEGILRSRIVTLDAGHLPREEAELDQLDILLISNFDLSALEAAEAAVIRSWVEHGGVLIFGTGARGDTALAPYFSDLLAESLQPVQTDVDMGEEFDAEGYEGGILRLTASAVRLKDGRDLLTSGGSAIVAGKSLGEGLVAVCGYDFCDIGAFSSQQISYIDKLFTAVLGQNRLDALSVSATERSLNEYWDIQELLQAGDSRKLPNVGLYLTALAAYVLLAGPGLWFFLRERGLGRIYRPCVLLCAGLGVLLMWVLGINTRFSGSFLTYAKIRNVSEESIAETDFINLRSPYREPYELNIKTEYYVYPVLRGSGYSGDLAAMVQDQELPFTSIDYRVDRTVLRTERASSFEPRYFQLTNNIPNVDGSFSADLTLFDGKISGTVTNGSVYSLSDAAILMYGKLVPLGRLDAGAVVDVTNAALVNVPVGEADMTAEQITSGSRLRLLRYYLRSSAGGYFSDACLVGFLREGQPGFTEDSIESFGTTLIVASLPLGREGGGMTEYSALSRDVRVISGDYDTAANTISGAVPTVLEYSLGGNSGIERLQFEALQEEEGGSYYVVPFAGGISLFNYRTGGFEPAAQAYDAQALAPYLSEQGTIQVRYTPLAEDSLARAQYLPMLEVTARSGRDGNAQD